MQTWTDKTDTDLLRHLNRLEGRAVIKIGFMYSLDKGFQATRVCASVRHHHLCLASCMEVVCDDRVEPYPKVKTVPILKCQAYVV
jgi:hypothetical protein